MARRPLNQPEDHSCLAGVDEAGLGPILGPLVVAGFALHGPRGIDPWRALADVVCRKRPRRGQLMVADSKKVNQGPHGFERLEQVALAFLGAWRGAFPPTLHDLLRWFGVDLSRLSRCPWYGDLDVALPLRCDRSAIELQVHILRRRLRRERIEVLHVSAHSVDAEEFNELIDETDNKSRAHFCAYSRVIEDLLRQIPTGARLVADRCGGIVHYRPSIARAWPDATVRTVTESEDVSSYRLRVGDADATVHFASRGEDRAFPTALASCLAKYVRELMIHVLNVWFTARIPELRPTAGYYVDGRRFLADIEGFAQRTRLPLRRLVRVR